MGKVAFLFALIAFGQVSGQGSSKYTNFDNSALTQAENGKWYFYQTFFKGNWYKADQFCRYLGMQLVTIPDYNDIKALSNLISKNVPDGDTNAQLWTSGNELAKNGTYVWMGNGRQFPDKSNLWNPNQPDHDGGVEHCITLWNTTEHYYLLNDENCNSQLYFICEYVHDLYV